MYPGRNLWTTNISNTAVDLFMVRFNLTFDEEGMGEIILLTVHIHIRANSPEGLQYSVNFQVGTSPGK